MRTFIAALVPVILAGCSSAASKSESRVDQTVKGAQTVRDEFTAARDSMKTAVAKLATMVEQPGNDLKATFGPFATAMDALDARVTAIRGRGTDLRARWADYLKNWTDAGESIQSPELKARAEKRRTELQADFKNLADKGQAVRAEFAPLQAALHDSRRFVEADFTPNAARMLDGEVAKIRPMEERTLKASDEFLAAIDTLLMKIRTTEPAAK